MYKIGRSFFLLWIGSSALLAGRGGKESVGSGSPTVPTSAQLSSVTGAEHLSVLPSCSRTALLDPTKVHRVCVATTAAQLFLGNWQVGQEGNGVP